MDLAQSDRKYRVLLDSKQDRIELATEQPSLSDMKDGEERVFISGNTLIKYRRERGKLYKSEFSEV